MRWLLVEMQRKEPLIGEKFSEIWVSGTAKRVGADPAAQPIAKVVSALTAYHEFEENRLREAANNPEYKPDKNDILDSEQLVYLGPPICGSWLVMVDISRGLKSHRNLHKCAEPPWMN